MGTADPDRRAAVFCAPEHPEVFHAVAHRCDIWKDDPFDVETIHQDARATFQRLIGRATSPSGTAAGRIFLLQGEAGSGKTHLMRAFRNWTHAGKRGYYGYMQMTSATHHYGRYILNNLIDSLDQPYDETEGETTGLMRLSTAIAESPRGVSVDRLQEIRGGELDHVCLARMVDALADHIVIDDRFNNIDLDLLRALLYLQTNDPRIKSRVLKYLRCEGLSLADRAVLGGLEPRAYDDAPERVIWRLAELMAALESVPLVLCVDQLEDIYLLDDAVGRFRRAMATLRGLVDAAPTLVVVISCLEDFYKVLREGLTKPLVDRIEKDPAPIRLTGAREEGEIVQIVGRRLSFLAESRDAPIDNDDPTYPFPSAYLHRLAGLRARDVLERCQEYRERCIAAGTLVDLEFVPATNGIKKVAEAETTSVEHAWNDHRTAFSGPLPDDENGLARLLAGAVQACSHERETGHWFEVETDGRMVPVECHDPDNSVTRLLIGVCNKAAQGGWLGKQIAEVEKRAGEHTPILVRSTAYPTDRKTAVSKQIGTLIARGGRRVVVENSDWRTMAAFPSFQDQHQSNPLFAAWRKQSQPLSRLRSLQTILGLDRLPTTRPAPPAPPPPAAPVAQVEPVPAPPTEPELATGPEPPLVVGVSDDRARNPVVLDPAELTRHAAFLGGTGSGKTTVALNVVEQLLLRGVPAILVDRKGDLAGYANAESWTRPLDDPERAERRDRLRARVEVAVYTPGNPQGRPLSIAIAPAGLAPLGSFERAQVARYAASALAGMMNYGAKKQTDQGCQAILARAIDLLAESEPGGSVTLEALIDIIAQKDADLVNAIGRLDTRLFEKLVQDLETQRLNHGELLCASGEPLEAEALLGLGRHSTPGKTRLSVISTKFLGDTQNVQFWVSQLLVEMARWASRSPSRELQAVLLFDEADLYLPATRQPPTKEPMENLLKRARSAGLGLLLATQSPGDFDYKCRDNIRAWFVGSVKQSTALAKMKPMLSECRGDVASKLPGQETGQFHLLRDGAATGLRAGRSVMTTEQLPEDAILALARSTKQRQGRG